MITFIKTGMARIPQRILWTWYALTLAIAITIVAPLAITLAAALGETMESPRLFQNFDISWITEIGATAQWTQLLAWSPVAIILGAAFILMTTWLTGGWLALLNDPPDNQQKDSFFAGCARWFPPFLRLWIFALPTYATAFAIRAACAALFRKLGEDSMSGKPSAYASMANLFVTLLAFSLANMLIDYAKIHMVTHNERRARIGFFRAVRFVSAHFGRCATLYLALTGLMLLMLAVYHISSEVIGQSSPGAVALLFIARQAYIFGRTWLRMVFLASEHAFFVSRLPKPEPEPKPEPAPPPMPEPVLESLEMNESY